MAYTVAVTVTDLGAGRYQVLVNETAEVAVTSETTLAATVGTTEVPYYGRVVEMQSLLVSGTGTTVDPVLGGITDPGAAGSAHKLILENATAAAAVNNRPAVQRFYSGGGAALFHRSVPSGSADNVVQTTYFILAGWGL